MVVVNHDIDANLSFVSSSSMPGTSMIKNVHGKMEISVLPGCRRWFDWTLCVDCIMTLFIFLVDEAVKAPNAAPTDFCLDQLINLLCFRRMQENMSMWGN